MRGALLPLVIASMVTGSAVAFNGSLDPGALVGRILPHGESELPDGWQYGGGRLIDVTAPVWLGIEIWRKDGGAMLFFVRLPEFLVLDALAVSVPAECDLALDECFPDNSVIADPELVAMKRWDWLPGVFDIRAAWRFNSLTHKIEPISTDGVSCEMARAIMAAGQGAMKR